MKVIIKKFNKAKQIKIILEYLNSLDCKKPIAVNIETQHKNRSADQNSVYWVWIKIICMEQDGIINPTKLDIELKHENLKEKFLKPKYTLSGRKYYTTKDLKTVGFNEFMENIRMAVIDFLGLSLFYPSDAELYDQLLTEYGM